MSTPIGERFSQVYLAKDPLGADSRRFRLRLAQRFSELCKTYDVQGQFGQYLVVEAGVQLPTNIHGVPRVDDLFPDGELRDVLDAITLFHRFLSKRFEAAKKTLGPIVLRAQATFADPEEWRSFVERALREERLGYRLDEACGVHYFVDEEFERNRVATLAGLDSPLLANARQAYEDAFRHLDNTPRDTKAAVRSIFEAAEILAKRVVPEAQRLNGKIIVGQLRAKCLAALGGDETEQNSLDKVFDSFGDWVDAMHLYRHGQDGHEPVAPSETLAVHAISTGSAYIRLLAIAALRLAA